MTRTLAFLLTVVAGGLLVLAATRGDRAHHAESRPCRPGTRNCNNCHPPLDPDPPRSVLH